MKEVEAMDFMAEVVDDESGETAARSKVLEHESGAALEVDLMKVDRKEILDQIQKLPDSMLEVMMGAEDPEEAEKQAREEDMISGVSGDTVEAFEEICVMGLEHPELTENNFEQMVDNFDFEVLFPIGSEIMEISLGDGGGIKDFHEPDSGKK